LAGRLTTVVRLKAAHERVVYGLVELSYVPRRLSALEPSRISQSRWFVACSARQPWQFRDQVPGPIWKVTNLCI